MIKLEDKLYTSTEVASILGVSLRSVYRYIEEGKLTAEVKTATGRHRFTKQDILDFLYPDGDSEPVMKEEKKKPVSDFSYSSSRSEMPSYSSVSKSVPTPAADEEDVDWLSKFRAAAEKFRQEESISAAPVKEEKPISSFRPTSDIHVVNTPAFEKEEDSNQFYYRSSLGGLKDIAQTLDKSAKEASLDYAFTLNAGLSLHKPIKPFSLLHAYVRPSDLNYFEKLLSLTPSDSSSAQLCLITADVDAIFKNREVLHGLSVVAKSQLRRDVDALAPDLKDELFSIL
jgi:excisionase family DNA binding protein